MNLDTIEMVGKQKYPNCSKKGLLLVFSILL